MKFRYSLKDKIVFYLEYIVLKICFIWFEVKKPKSKMFLYEILYSIKKFINRSSLPKSPFKENLIRTKFGIFRIRPYTVDMSTVSPAFERRDIDYLLRLIHKQKDVGEKILFVDIGADIGTFAITVGNQFKNYDRLFIVAFEPAKSSYALLEENVKINNLKNKVELYEFALFNENNREIEFQFNPDAPTASWLNLSASSKSSLKVSTKTLDFLLTYFLLTNFSKKVIYQ